MTSRYYGRRALLWGVIALLSAAFCLSLHPAAAADRQQQDVTEAQQVGAAEAAFPAVQEVTEESVSLQGEKGRASQEQKKQLPKYLVPGAAVLALALLAAALSVGYLTLRKREEPLPWLNPLTTDGYVFEKELPAEVVHRLFQGVRLISFIVFDDNYYLSVRPEYTPDVQHFIEYSVDDVREAEEKNLEKQLEGKLAKPPTKEGEIFYVTVKTLEGIEVKFRVFEQALRRKKTPEERAPEIGTVEAEFEKRHN
ncbi:hypothetical protein Efla_007552 [Eimeria flavescens]